MAYKNEVVRLEQCLIKSEAFRSLSQTAIIVYLNFRMKCQMHELKTPRHRQQEWIIRNNGKLEYCYSTAEKQGISRRQFAKALDQLIEHGFIEIAHSGSGGKKGDKSLYSVINKWKNYGMVGFSVLSRPKDTREGHGWAVYNARKVKSISDKNDTQKGVSSGKKNTRKSKVIPFGVAKTTLESLKKAGVKDPELLLQ